jgi:hypothetical protein
MDLKEGWEKKALIGLGVVVLIIIIYAYFIPFTGTPEPSIQANQSPSATVPVPYVIPGPANNSTSNNSTNNGNFTLNADQAKTIALNANPGYSAGSVTQGNIEINGTSYSVWIIAITKVNASAKTVFVDASAGKIIQTT